MFLSFLFCAGFLYISVLIEQLTDKQTQKHEDTHSSHTEGVTLNVCHSNMQAGVGWRLALSFCFLVFDFPSLALSSNVLLRVPYLCLLFTSYLTWFVFVRSPFFSLSHTPFPRHADIQKAKT